MKQTLLGEEELRQNLEELNSGLEDSWHIDNRVLSKIFVFRNFIEAFGFMTAAAITAEKLNHHPDWSNVYKTVTVNLTTHESGGITALDFSLAKKMEEICKR